MRGPTNCLHRFFFKFVLDLSAKRLLINSLSLKNTKHVSKLLESVF